MTAALTLLGGGIVVVGAFLLADVVDRAVAWHRRALHRVHCAEAIRLLDGGNA